jgi:hypothetical protein
MTNQQITLVAGMGLAARAALATTVFLLTPITVVSGLMTPLTITTWYVRNDGGSTAQCTGKSNAPYPGSGMAQACAYSNLQDALNAATFGDTVKLHSGDTFTTTGGLFSSFYLLNKGTPPTGTDADFITVTTDDSLRTPSALGGYPATGTRITTTMANLMPHVRVAASTPAFGFMLSTKYWKIERLDISNVDVGTNCIVLFGMAGGQDIGGLSQYPDHITIQYNWIHPIEEVGTALSSGNINRTAQNAVYLDGTNILVQNNSIQGFVGRAKYGGDVGQRMTSAGYLQGSYANQVTIQNNLIEAWTYGFFSGGSSMPDWLVTNGGTITTCSSSTVCTFSTIRGLAVGDPLAVLVSTAGQATWGATFVESISGNTVTFTAPLCHSYDGNNTCKGIPNNPTPANGDKIRWRGLQPSNVSISRNIFAHYPEWTTLMNGDCGGKGYLEVKSCVNCIFNGNVFTGCTGPTVTVRNQGGDFPWASLDGLTFSNNYWVNSNNSFVTFLRDSSPTPKSQNVSWVNNLYLGLVGNTAFFSGGQFSGATGGGINVTFNHNTVAWSKSNTPGMTVSAYRNFINFRLNGRYDNAMRGFVFRNNIVPIAGNICFHDGSGTSSEPITSCWPAATVDHNVFLNVDGYLQSDMNQWWLRAFPGNTLITSYGAVGFTRINSALTSAGNYRLLNSSPYHNAGSDGTDIGVNYTALVTALGFDPNGQATSSPRPTPSLKLNDSRVER